MRKKGMSAVMEFTLILVIGLVVFIIFSTFSKGAFLQEKSLFQKQISLTGEIPCTKSANLQLIESVPGAVYINATSGTFPQHVTTPFNATISTFCLENLSVRWDFGDKTPSVEANCSYVSGVGYATWDAVRNKSTPYGCTKINHTYTLNSESDIWAVKNVRVSAFGMSSGFYSEAITTGFVTDPTFTIRIGGVPDTDEFSCVRLDASINSLRSGITLNDVTLNVIDNNRLGPIEQVGNIFRTAGSILYKASISRSETVGKTEHTVQLLATKGYQTVRSDKLSYTPNATAKPPKEIAVLGTPNILNIYKTDASLLDSGLLPKTDYQEIDMSADDLNNDGTTEFVFFLRTDQASYEGGDIFVQTYPEMKGTKTPDKLTPDQLKASWPAYASLRSEHDLQWRAAATGKKIISPDGKTGNVIVIGDPGDLDLYLYAADQLTLIKNGAGFTNLNWWKDVKAYDADGDGIDEIMALRGANANNVKVGDILMFKYADFAKADTKTEFKAYPDAGKSHKSSDPYWINIENKEWVAVTAGNLAGNENYTVIVNLGPGELDAWWFNKQTKNFGEYHEYKSWPSDVTWRDVTAVDYNSDGIDELAFLYEKGGKYYVSVLPFSKISSINSYDKFKNAAIKTIELPSEGVNWYRSLIVNDLGCFL